MELANTKVHDISISKGDPFFNAVRDGKIPETPPFIYNHPQYYRFAVNMFGKEVDSYDGRSYCTERGMWAVVAHSWVSMLAKWIDGRSVLELMSGTGWLGKALQKNGVNVHCTDNMSWFKGGRHSIPPIIDMEEIEAEAAAIKYVDEYDIFMCSWPYMDLSISYAVRHLVGKPFIYIGESMGGCCATDEFFRMFHESWEAPVKNFFSWDGMNDDVHVGVIMFEKAEVY